MSKSRDFWFRDVHTVDSILSRAVQDAPVYNVQQKQSSKRQNRRERSHTSMAFFMLVTADDAKEHQDGHAPHATVLDGSVELGRFLLQEASHE